MQREKVLDDLAQLAGGTVSIVSGIGQNVKAEIKTRVEEVIDRLDLVPRGDLERVEAVLQETRARVEALEKQVSNTKKKTTKKTAKKR